MKTRTKYILLCILVTTAISGQRLDEELKSFMERYYVQYLSFHPFIATQNGFVDYNDKFPIEISEEYLARNKKFNDTVLDSLYTFNRSLLNVDLKVSYDLLEYILNDNIESSSFPDHLMPVNHYQFLLQFISMGSGNGIQPFNTIKDYDNFLKRIENFTSWVNTAIGNMKKGVKYGIVLPKRIAAKTIEIVRDQIVDNASQSIFYSPILNFPESFSSTHRLFFANAYHEAITHYILPSFKKLEQFLSNEYIPQCRNNIGLCYLPDGKEWYKHYIHKFTTLSIDPDTIMQTGIREVERIQGQIIQLKEKHSFYGTNNQFRRILNSEVKLVFNIEDLIDQYEELGEKIESRLPLFFDVIPKTRYTIQAIDSKRAKYMGAHYIPAPQNDNSPGIFYFDGSFIETYGGVANKSLFIHETLPGHHFQISISHEMEELPTFQKYYWNSGYGEGWALYCETLGEELGVYENDLDYFTKYNSELLRAVRLVVDVGIHYKGWSFHEALNYFVTNTDWSVSAAENEIDRYIVTPGQALTYKIGELKIMQLKQLAEVALGDEFSLKEFHRQVLIDGTLPLPFLELKIVNWLSLKQTTSLR